MEMIISENIESDNYVRLRLVLRFVASLFIKVFVVLLFIYVIKIKRGVLINKIIYYY